ncbi:metalloendoproteinase 1 [Phtheirospermum japonicum]|uniref:Metalloendoproteinase 1 n=1 Tax=Phtheirospermum japonicum TaxID=374723 RepID=A0A830BDI3_9LAMI|nr:metalloendoproteinase 1 [Phtheirospermum japonicum]
MPHWALRSPMTLSYAFSPPPNVIDYVSLPDLKAAFGRAFSRWSAVIPVSFTEAADYSHADIRIRWYSGEHGDGLPFDGPLGVLAHAFAPENGNLHLDAAERWAVDLAAEGSQAAVDLESVATHEIGHILGLQHSSNSDAVMYATLSPRTKKVELRKDDVDGVQGLYGSKPGYRFVPVSEPSSSSGRMMKWNFASPWLSWLVLLVFRIY